MRLRGYQCARCMLSFVEKIPTYRLVEDCYVHGLMNGEGLGMRMEEDIILV